MTLSRLHQVAAAGQSVWADQISRSMLDSGELDRRIREDAVTGVTSNPSIFAGAIVGSSDYDDLLKTLVGEGASTTQIMSNLMAGDLTRACDALRPVWEQTEGRDGYVSVEVDPEKAHDTDGTVEEAAEWVNRIGRPNLLIKVPATRAGIPAIRTLTSQGVCVNVTLIFSLGRYAEVIEAYLSGLEELSAEGADLSQMASVASFFVSRLDSDVDPRLEAIGTTEALELRGKAAVANARAAYRLFLDSFAGERWERLESAGARVQRPLWASTSTKNPAYRDTLYVDTLIAPHTVNTMPLPTMDAFQDHGPAVKVISSEDLEDAAGVLRSLNELGINYEEVVDRLENQGVAAFINAWRTLLEDIDGKRRLIAGD